MNYVPGKGGGLIPAVGAGVAATQLPQTGPSFINEAALFSVAFLVTWAVVYKLVAKKTA